MKGLNDKNVLVTGGTSDIGQAIAVRFAAERAHVAINYRKDIDEAGQTDEMAAITAFPASDDAAYITGQTLFVDGGLTLYPDFRVAWSSE